MTLTILHKSIQSAFLVLLIEDCDITVLFTKRHSIIAPKTHDNYRAHPICVTFPIFFFYFTFPIFFSGALIRKFTVPSYKAAVDDVDPFG